MQCYDTLSPICARGTAVALGYFDGVHLGHRSVLRAAQETARRENLDDAVFTFTLPVPAVSPNNSEKSAGSSESSTTTPTAKGNSILTQTEKRRRMESCGLQHYFCPPFLSFCMFTPAQFVDEILVRCLHARAVFCGGNFTFGVQKSGDVPLLRTLCDARGIAVHVVEMAQYAHESVSSSRVRAALAQGDIPTANAMLGEAYRIDFPVQPGKQLGRTLGFPTINQIYPPGMLLPREGVYLTRTLTKNANGALLWLPSATGLGTRPTVTGGAPDIAVTCETFIVDYSGALYGENVAVTFHSYWRPTQRFASLDALKDYIAQAADAARAQLSNPPFPDTTHEEAAP